MGKGPCCVLVGCVLCASVPPWRLEAKHDGVCVRVQARCLADGGEEPGTPAHERVLEIIGARVRSPLHHAVMYLSCQSLACYF